MKVIVVDDEPLALQSTQRVIEEHFSDVKVVGLAKNISIAKRLILETNPDLILCDIQMPGGTGFELLDHFPSPNFQVVFITAFDHYAIKAFKYSAIDYLLKPYATQDLVSTIKKAKGNKDKADYMLHLKALIENKEKLSTLVISGHDRTHAVNMVDLIMLEADSNYTKLFVNNSAEEILSSKTLKNFEEQLPENDFFRIHHSYIVNREHIQFFSSKSGEVTVKGDIKIKVSQRKLKSFVEWFH